MNFQWLSCVGVYQDDSLLAVGRFDCLDMLLGCCVHAELAAFAEICTMQSGHCYIAQFSLENADYYPSSCTEKKKKKN